MPKKSYTLAYFREMVIFGVPHPGGGTQGHGSKSVAVDSGVDFVDPTAKTVDKSTYRRSTTYRLPSKKKIFFSTSQNFSHRKKNFFFAHVCTKNANKARILMF